MAEAVYQAFGARVQMLREMLGVEQATVAKRAKMSRPSLANIESGRQRIALHRVMELADALGTTPRGLMKGIWW